MGDSSGDLDGGRDKATVKWSADTALLSGGDGGKMGKMRLSLAVADCCL